LSRTKETRTGASCAGRGYKESKENGQIEDELALPPSPDEITTDVYQLQGKKRSLKMLGWSRQSRLEGLKIKKQRKPKSKKNTNANRQ